MSLWHWWQQQAPTVLTTIGIGSIFGKVFIMRPLKRFIKATVIQATKPIQPDANGGKSLPDIAVTLAKIETTINGIDTRLRIVDKRLDRHIEQHVVGGV